MGTTQAFGWLTSLCPQTVRPVTAFALIQELIFRDGLRIALGGRDDVTMEPILNFLARHIDDSRFGGMAAEVADVLIGKFGPTSFCTCPHLLPSCAE